LGHHSTLDLRVVLESEQFQNRRFGQRRGSRWTGTAPRFRVFWRQERTPMSDWINAIFGQGQNLSAGQECARAVVIFIWGFLLIRFAGRRIFGQWAALDTVVAIMAGSNLSRAITGSAPLFGTMVATAVLVALHWALAKLTTHSTLMDRVLEGEAVELGANGVLHDDKMKKWAVSGTDLAQAMRQSGVSRIEDIERVTLEPSGTISVSGAK